MVYLTVFGTDGSTPYAPHIDDGTSEATKSADFLVLDANPLDNITNTRKISCVYLRGAEGDRAPFRVTPTQ
jgi:hypothetical protein